MTAYAGTTTIFADADAESEWDGEHIRISLFGNVNGRKADAVMVGQVLLTPHTILKMHNAVTKGMNSAFKTFERPRATVLEFAKTGPDAFAMKGA